MTKKKKNKEKKGRKKDEKVAALYREDIGSVGVKRQFVDPEKEQAQFQIKVNSSEKRKRLDRMVGVAALDSQTQCSKGHISNVSFLLRSPKERFSGTTIGTDTSSSKKPMSTFDLLNMSLSSSRTPCTTARKRPRHAKGSFIGESTTLEKPYLRLTTYPKREDVRPLHVLRCSLIHVKEKYRAEEDFEWTNAQMKSIRQDLTVQNIRDTFTLEVYETHARILLENGDLNEFNQCQTMLRSLTEGSLSDPDGNHEFANGMGSEKKSVRLEQTVDSADEFRAYSILYALIRKSWSRLKLDLIKVKVSIEAGGSCCKHALKVVNAVNCENYHAFFRLYESAPRMSPYLMDFLLQRVRDLSFGRMVASYRPSLSLSFLQASLGFSDYEETRIYLKRTGAVFIKEGNKTTEMVDCKGSMAAHRC